LKIGQERIDKIWETVREYTTSDVEQISSEYNDLIAIDIEMIELCKILKQKGYKLGILANESYDWMNIKKKRYDLDKIFDIVYSSADIKVAKPEKESYLKIIENLHARPEETLFIDNLSRNTQAAEALGIKSLLFTDSDQLQKDLAKMNIV
jgi:HAD superfamily hydrolase (TIGR01509 family)